MSEKVKVALNWLKGLLESENIEYQIVGGLAATIHGSSREVVAVVKSQTSTSISTIQMQKKY